MGTKYCPSIDALSVIRIRSVYHLPWKLFVLGVIALALLIINFGLSWWIRIKTFKNTKDIFPSFPRNELSLLSSSTLSEIFEIISHSSILDNSGEFRYAIGVVNGENIKDYLRVGESEKVDDITLVTQCSLARIHLLPELVTRWKGPLSIALFLVSEEMHEGIQVIHSLRRCFPEIKANVIFSIVYPVGFNNFSLRIRNNVNLPCEKIFSFSEYNLNYQFKGTPYPNNLLRNVARKGTNTNFIMVLDIDMIPSLEIRPKFMNFINENRASTSFDKEEEKTAWVIPAYEMEENVIYPEDKSELLQQIEKGKARPFYVELCLKCQKHTNYKAWEEDPGATNEGDLKFHVLYEVLWKDAWEPFYIARSNVPMYDERFRQFGLNRISQLCELHVSGYRFLVLNSAFVVHKGFKKEKYMHREKDQELVHNRLLFRKFKQELKIKYPLSSRRCY